MTARDVELERRIDRAALELQTGATPAARRVAMARLRELVAQRTAARVAEMERAKGLA